MGNHLATAFRRGPVVLFAGEDQGRGDQRHQRKKAGRVIGDREPSSPSLLLIIT
jgi:hypothetical protein